MPTTGRPKKTVEPSEIGLPVILQLLKIDFITGERIRREWTRLLCEKHKSVSTHEKPRACRGVAKAFLLVCVRNSTTPSSAELNTAKRGKFH